MKTGTWLATAVLASSLCASAGENDAGLEIKELDSFATAKSWRLEANVRAKDSPETINGHPALQLTFNIVHRQPDGSMQPSWPHGFLHLDPKKNDWSAYDNLEFQIHTSFNRSDETYLPFAVSVQNSNNTYSGHIQLPKLVQNRWVKFSLPVAEFPSPHDVKRLGFHASGAKYRDGDVLTVTIGEFRLTRATTPIITQAKLLTPAVFVGASVLGMDLTVAGPVDELQSGLPVEIVSDGKPVWQGALPAERGAKRYELDIAAARLVPGKYRLVLLANSTEHKVECPLTVVASPWDAAE